VNLIFASKAPQKSRAALEELFYFNPRQHRVREGIINSLAHFGHPRLEESDGGITICVGEHTPQTIFAFDTDRLGSDPVGVVVFLRTSPADMAIMHIAVHPDYALKKSTSGVGLGTVLIEKVREIAARVVGVQRIIFFYRQEVVIRL
jgi:hypothetical protein